jgi:hypothetical protein
LFEIEEGLKRSEGVSGSKWKKNGINSTPHMPRTVYNQPAHNSTPTIIERPVIPVHRKRKSKQTEWTIEEKKYKEVDVESILERVGHLKDEKNVKREEREEVKLESNTRVKQEDQVRSIQEIKTESSLSATVVKEMKQEPVETSGNIKEEVDEPSKSIFKKRKFSNISQKRS